MTPPSQFLRATALSTISRIEVVEGQGKASADVLVVEEPLEIRIRGVSIAVVMRTPGHDFELVRGFLLNEGIVSSSLQIQGMRYCLQHEVPEAEDNIVQVQLDPQLELDLNKLRRNFYAGSSCGVCGKATIEAALARGSALADGNARFDSLLVASSVERLSEEQVLFSATGGLHAAGLVDSSGKFQVVREDIGRHNAVDKVIGWAAKQTIPLDQCFMVVSGRISYEIAQKVLAAGIPLVAAVSAPSALAVKLAQEANLSLAAFVRGQRFSVYAGAHRFAPQLISES